MNTTSTKRATLLSTSLLAPLSLLASAPVLAGLITVNSTADPQFPSAANCTGAAQACSLREALAAADATPEHDVILFNVDQPITLDRKLVAHQPVTLDGGGTTLIRVNQDYSIAMLSDIYPRDAESYPVVPVLQPVWNSVAAGQRFMLELYGSGSEVLNLAFDGSITPPPGEITVERVDFNSDGVTDFVLRTVDSNGEDTWPVVGGVFTDFYVGVQCDDNPPLGTIHINGNTFSNLAGTGITLGFYWLAQVNDNVVTGGSWPEDGFFGNGISAYCGAAGQITNNYVSGYQSGVKVTAATAMSISDNEVSGNGTGIELEFAGAQLAPNSIADNEATGNLDYGIKLFVTSMTSVTGNELKANGSHPQIHGGMLVLNSEELLIQGNEAKDNSGFGFAIDASRLNTMADNQAKNSGGAGIAVVNGSHDNTLTGNQSTRNRLGIVLAVTAEDAPAPFDNQIEANTFKQNWELDALDLDSDCNDAWLNNQIGTAFAVSGSCIQ